MANTVPTPELPPDPAVPYNVLLDKNQTRLRISPVRFIGKIAQAS